VSRWLAPAFAVDGLADDDQARRARLLAIATAFTVLCLVAIAGDAVVEGERALLVIALGLAPIGVVGYRFARRGRLAAAEWSAAALVALASVSLIALHGPASLRLGVLHIGVVFLGLAARPWMAPAQVALSLAALLGALAAGAQLPLAPSNLPGWIAIARQVVLTTALMMVFTHGYRRLLATLARRTTELDAAHGELVAARARLERLVGQRTAALERASVDLEAFARLASHDLRAPLRHVTSYLSLFAEDAAALGEARLAPIAAARVYAEELMVRLDAILAASRRAAASGDPRPPRSGS
jgi:signal transduction histidine kinase